MLKLTKTIWKKIAMRRTIKQIPTVADPIPSTSRTREQIDEENLDHIQNSEPSSSGLLVSPRDIVPVPKCKTKRQKNTRKRGSSEILTDSPYKNELQLSKESKNTTAVKNKFFIVRKPKTKLRQRNQGFLLTNIQAVVTTMYMKMPSVSIAQAFSQNPKEEKVGYAV